MLDKDPTTWTAGTWILAFGMAIGGGVINWYSKFKDKHPKAFSFFEFIFEILVSGFVGLGSFMLMVAFDQSAVLCAVASGIGGHMGTKLITLVEKFIEFRFKDMEKSSHEPE